MTKLDKLSDNFKEILTDLNLNLDTFNYLKQFNDNVKDIIEEYKNDYNTKPLEIKSTPKKEEIVGYMGVEGAFADEASKALFPNALYHNYETFKDVFNALKNKEINYGILPLENSLTGSINDNYDLLREYNCYIIKDINLKVTQNLLGIKGSKLEDIKCVFSHPQALLQSKKFLDDHNIKSEVYSNTATSAKYIKELNNKNIGSISSLACAKLYNLDVLATNINEVNTNTTRFIVVSRDLEVLGDAKQISIIFNLKHEIGNLYQILKDIKDYNLNLTRIESRPIKNKPFEYFFYLDFLGNINDLNVLRALTKIKQDTINFRIIGNY